MEIDRIRNSSKVEAFIRDILLQMKKKMFILQRWSGAAMYEILTQLIILLGAIRRWICSKSFSMLVVRKDRTFVSPDARFGYLLVCCDCAAQHKVWVKKNVEYMQPIRPPGYNYRLRYFCLPPSRFENKE